MVPDDTLTIRERAIAAWPLAWQGQNLRDIVTTLGFDIDRPWRDLPKKDRDWLLFTDEQPVVPVYAGYDRDEVSGRSSGVSPRLQRHLHGRQAVCASHVRHDAERVDQEARGAVHGEQRVPALPWQASPARGAVGEVRRIGHRRHVETALARLADIARPYADGTAPDARRMAREHPEKALVARRISEDLIARLTVLLDLGLGYLSLERSTPTLSPGELQRLRLATQVRSNLFGVVYVLDEPSAGLHPADTEALLSALEQLEAVGQFAVRRRARSRRHSRRRLDRRRGAGGGRAGRPILYSGPPNGLAQVEDVADAPSSVRRERPARRRATRAQRLARLAGVTRNNLNDLDVAFPLGVLTTVTGVSGPASRAS